MSFVAAAVLGGTAIVGGVISSANNRAASREAVAASQQATDQNNALSRDIYNQNRQTLAPFVNQGSTATSYINSLLGIPNAQPQPQQQMGQSGFGGMQGETPQFSGGGLLGNFGNAVLNSRRNDMGGGQMGMNPAIAAGGAVPTAGNVQANPNAGFDAFRNSTGYNFRLNEGMRAINANQSARGLLNSGDTLRRLNQFGQDSASAEFGNYYNALAGQQSLGANAANAQAGIASNYSSQVQQNNAANASNVGNAALARAGNNNAFLSSVIGAGAYLAGGKR